MAEKVTGKAIGGKARAAKMTAEERSAVAKKAAEARKELAKLPKATHGSADHPLKIGDAEIPCYVLSDGTRVLSQRGMVAGLGMTYGSGAGGADRLTGFVGGKGISPFINKDILALIENPIRFTHSGGGGIAFGYPATLLADICDAVLSARQAGALKKQQEHIAQQAEILVRGFARVGIIALVDEATGYQRDRAKDALAKILEAYVEKELQPWIKTFDSDYYENMFRLRGLPFPPEKINYRPAYFGHLTNDIVYSRLAPGVLSALKEEAKRDAKKSVKLFQHLTAGFGRQELLKHLGRVTALMELSSDWPGFIAKLNRISPRLNETLMLDLDEPDR